MTDRAIFAVDINDGEFQAFAAKYDAFKTQLAGAPKSWADAARQQDVIRANLDRMRAAMSRLNEALDKAGEGETKTARQGADLAGTWHVVGARAKLFVSDLRGATESLVKWGALTSFFSTVLAAGGLYGIGRTAMSVSGGRSSAMALGVTYGQKTAFETYFGRLGNAPGLLATFNRAIHSYEGSATLYGLMGKDAQGAIESHNPATAFAKALPYIKKFADSANPDTLASSIQSRGYNKLGLTTEIVTAIKNMSQDEINEMIADANGQAGALDPGGAVTLQWQEFDTALDLAASQISTAFARGLSHLTPGISRVADAFADIVTKVLKPGGFVEEKLKQFNSGLVEFGQTLDSTQAQRHIDDFLRNVAKLGELADFITGRVQPNPGANQFGGGYDPSAPFTPKDNPDFTPVPGGGTGSHGEDDTPEQAERRHVAGGASGSRDGGEGGAGSPAIPRNSSGGGASVYPGRNPDLGNVDPRLLEVVNGAAKHLPKGYKVLIREGYNPNGHAPGSMHHRRGAGAVDFVIVGPDGKEIPNRGGDPTGIYHLLHRHMEGELRARYPDLYRRRAMRHGTNFETRSGSKAPDLMHVDFGGLYGMPQGRGFGGPRVEDQGPVDGERYGADRAPKPSARVRLLNRQHPAHTRGKDEVFVHDHSDGDVSVHTETRGPR